MVLSQKKQKVVARNRRHKRVRTRILGTAKRPRLSVFRSNTGVYAQLIDDEKGKTLLSVNWKQVSGKSPVERAHAVGVAVAKAAKTKKINRVVFDRGGFLYTGQVSAVAEGAREGSLTL